MEPGNRQVVSTYTFADENSRSINTANCFQDGSKIAVGIDGFTVAVWDGSPDRIQTLTGRDPEADPGDDTTSDVYAVAPSKDAKLIAAAHGQKVDIWTAGSATLLRQIKTRENADAVAFINGDREIAICDKSSREGMKYTMGVWNVRSGKRVREFAPTDDPVVVSVVSDDGRMMALADIFGFVNIWDVKSGGLRSRFKAADGITHALALAADTHSVLVGQQSGEIAMLDTRSGEEIGKFIGHTKEVSTVAFSPDGKRVLSGSWDGTFRLWDTQTRKTILIGEAGDRGWASWTPEFAFVTSPEEALHVFSSHENGYVANPDFTDDKARPDLVAKALAQ
jgi:WD40 repeat protein